MPPYRPRVPSRKTSTPAPSTWSAFVVELKRRLTADERAYLARCEAKLDANARARIMRMGVDGAARELRHELGWTMPSLTTRQEP